MDDSRARIALVGVGNAMVGDDGAGVEVVRRLTKRWGGEPRVWLHVLEGDLYEISDHLERAEEFLFVDAVAGERPGEVVRCRETPRAFAPSFHQTDVGAVMRCLEAIGVAQEFPPWEVWGIVIEPPHRVGYGLSPPVEEAVERLTEDLSQRIEGVLG